MDNLLGRIELSDDRVFFLLLGIPVFVWTRCNAIKDDPAAADRRIFTRPELAGAIAIVLVTLISLGVTAAKSHSLDTRFHK